MKKYMTLLLLVFMTVGAFASGVTEQNSAKSYRIYTEKLIFNDVDEVLAEGVQVAPTDGIISVLQDYIDDVYDDDDYEDIRLPKTNSMFSNVEEFVAVGTDYTTVSKFFSLYVDDVIIANTDDVLYDINEELVAALRTGDANVSYMILGDTKVTCVRDFTI